MSCRLSTASHAALYVAGISMTDLFKLTAMKGLQNASSPWILGYQDPHGQKQFGSFPAFRQTDHVCHNLVFLFIQKILTEHLLCARICRVSGREFRNLLPVGEGDGESLEKGEKQFLEAQGGCGESGAFAQTPSARENVCEKARHNAGSVSNIWIYSIYTIWLAGSPCSLWIY